MLPQRNLAAQAAEWDGAVRFDSGLALFAAPQGCHPESSLSSRAAGRKQAKDLCIPRRPHPQRRCKSSLKGTSSDMAGLWRALSSTMHRSFVGSPPPRGGLLFLRMTGVIAETDRLANLRYSPGLTSASYERRHAELAKHLARSADAVRFMGILTHSAARPA